MVVAVRNRQRADQAGRPQQNGRHERMHLTLKKEATKPPVRNFPQQQARFDRFIDCLNNERPHQALNKLLLELAGDIEFVGRRMQWDPKAQIPLAAKATPEGAAVIREDGQS